MALSKRCCQNVGITTRRHPKEQQRVERGLARFVLHWPTIFAAHRLSDNLGLLDSLIGHTAVSLSKPLATFNTKHDSAIPALQTVQPC